MSPRQTGGDDARGAALGDAFSNGWRRLTAADANEPDLNRLAAYAEGRLTPAEEAAVASEMGDSPIALEIVAALLEGQDQPRQLPVAGATPAPGELERPALPPVRDRRRSQLAAWAMAACVLVAAWGVLSTRYLKNEVAALSRRADDAALALLVADKERLAALSDADSGSYLLGATSPDLSDLAVADFGQALAGNLERGGPDLSDKEAAAIDDARLRLAAAAEGLDLSNALAGQLERAAALIQAEQFDDARKLLYAIQSSALGSRITLAQWENVRAGLYAAEAAETPVAEGEPLWAQAEALFRSAGEHGLHQAWLNLALLLVQLDKRDEAVAAARRYLEDETDPQRRAILEELVGGR